jgi:hypothetical protein
MFLALTNYEFEHCISLDCILALTPGPQLEQRTFGVLFEVDISTLTHLSFVFSFHFESFPVSSRMFISFNVGFGRNDGVSAQHNLRTLHLDTNIYLIYLDCT